MKYEPHNYQVHATRYIEEHPNCAVWLDMGLGKTSIAMTALNNLLFDSFEAHRILVIAPLRVARYTWPVEADKWDHLQNLICSVAVGTEADRRRALLQQADIYIINRENVQWLIEESNLPFNFDTLVVDELSSFKNYQAKRFRALMRVRPRVKRVIGLTGTPSTNGLMDLWAEFRLLDMGQRLGRFIGRYRLDYFQPDKRNGHIVFNYKPLPGAEERIYDKISDITISMKSTDHLKMPELISSEYTVYLSESEKQRYEELKTDLILQLPSGDITAANAAALTGKLCQMANGAIYSNDGQVSPIHERKLDALEDMIEAAGGNPVLVAYWFKHDLVCIAQRLRKLGVAYAKLDTKGSFEKWNTGELPVALIHPASAGHGLNLQSGGSTLIWFGLTWSLELYQQTIARIWRQGQRAKTVVVHHIITNGTIDERILKVLSKKDSTQAALIEAVKADMKI
jgi:SNF2 family DNA or RNA helicase